MGIFDWLFGKKEVEVPKKECCSKEDDQKSKLTKTYYENGNLEKEGNYTNGKEEGLWKSYHENEQLDYEFNYKNGIKHGLIKTYDKNGHLDYESNYKNGVQDGLTKSYENGKLRVEGNYKIKEEYREIIKSCVEENPYLVYVDKTGLWKWYHENGKLSRETNYMNDNKHGITKHYYENGQLEFETKYSYGKVLYQKSWDEDGNEIE